MRLPRRPAPRLHVPAAAPHAAPTPPLIDRGSSTRRTLGVGLAALGGAAVVGLLGPVAPLVEGSTSVIDAPAPVPAEGAVAAVDEPAVVTDDEDADEVLAVRFTTRLEQRETVIPAPEEQRDNSMLPVGATRIDQVGVDGIRHEVIEVIHRNGDVIDERVTEVVEIAPTPTITSIGTATSSAATKNWAALAQCESSGNPTIVSSSGRYHGLYQFDLPTWRSVGGTGLPSQASPDEQTRRAMALYDQRGASPWPTCGRHL
jgi:resuscitation-promoting factor RpfB